MKRLQPRLRSEAGMTLAEVLVTVTILGLAVAGITQGLGTASLASDYHRKQVSADIVVRSYAEAIKERVRVGGYIPCATPASYAIASRPGGTIPYEPEPGYTVSESTEIGYQVTSDLNLILVLDRSGSIEDNWGTDDEAEDVRNAAKAFLQNVNNKGSYVALVSFSSEASVDVTMRELTDASLVTFEDAIDDLDFVGGTNWEDAMIKAHDQLEFFPETSATQVVLITDGEPTQHHDIDGDGDPDGNGNSFDQDALDFAEGWVNTSEADGAKVFGLGVALQDENGRTALKELTAEPNSSAREWEFDNENSPSFRDADWGEVDDFGDLEAALEVVAETLTGESFSTACPVPDQGAQMLTIQAASVDGRDTETLQMIVRRP